MNTLQIKTLRDLWLYKSRTILVVLAIAIGTAAAGVAATSFVVLRTDLREGYRRTNPAYAILDLTSFDASGVDGSLAGRVAELPGVREAELRREAMGQLRVAGGETRSLQLWVLPDFDAATIGTLSRQPGAAVPPPEGTVLLERSIVPALGVAQDDVVNIQLLGGDPVDLAVAGFVNDLAVTPTTVNPVVHGYITPATAAALGLPAGYNQLQLTVSASDPDRATVETVVTAVSAWLKDEGVIVTRATIPEPGVHPMQGNVDTGLLMIGILGGLTLLLSAFLVTNVMSAVIAQQVPVIGVLKTLGSGRGLVFRQYGRMVLIFGLLALALAVPLGLMGAWFQCSYLAGQLNFDIPSFGLPWQTLLIQVAGALVIPALAAWGPLRAAAGLTVREAISPVQDTPVKPRKDGDDASRVSHIAYLVAWRNIARRKIRLVLTLAALSLAGAIFIATFGLRSGLIEAIEILISEFPYDVQVDFAEPQPADRMAEEAAGIDGVERVETWGVADARRVYPDGRVGSSLPLFGVPATTEIAAFANRDGRWLNWPADDVDDSVPLYINYEAEKITFSPAVDDMLTLRINGLRDSDARLVGISLRPFEAGAYMPYADFEAATGMSGQAGRLIVSLDSASSGDPARQAAVAGELTRRYHDAGMPIAYAGTASSFREALQAQFNTLVVLLMALAGLTALVGGLGLANTMALNVMERSREIGIMRSMGAQRPLLRRMVLIEGLAVALISAAVAVALSVPMTLVLDRVMGVSLMGSPLAFAFSAPAALGWLALVVIIGLAACWLPAENAARLTIREALAYE